MIAAMGTAFGLVLAAITSNGLKWYRSLKKTEKTDSEFVFSFLKGQVEELQEENRILREENRFLRQEMVTIRKRLNELEARAAGLQEIVDQQNKIINEQTTILKQKNG